MLINWEDLFKYVPIETEIKKYQDEYYKAIQNSNSKGNSIDFIEFMLKMIDAVLDELIEGVNIQVNHKGIYVKNY